MPDLSFASVCRIAAYKTMGDRKVASMGNGVFMTPFHVLTSWHILEKAEDVEFFNMEGDRARIKWAARGGVHCGEQSLDIALLEMTFDIAPDIALPPRGLPTLKSVFEDVSAVMKTCHDGVPVIHPVTTHMANSLGHMFRRETMTFYADIETRHGHSGSPVFEEDGVTLLSVVYGNFPEEVQRARDDGASSPQAARRIPFLAVHPQKLADWYKGAERKLGLA